jgi:hypothetical protein
MTWNFRQRFAPGEVIFELRAGFLFIGEHLRLHNCFPPIKLAELSAGAGIVTDAFGKDIARAGQRSFRVGDAFFGTNESFGLGKRVGRGLLIEENVCQWLEPLLFRDGGSRSAFGTERLINIFQSRDCFRLRDR